MIEQLLGVMMLAAPFVVAQPGQAGAVGAKVDDLVERYRIARGFRVSRLELPGTAPSSRPTGTVSPTSSSARR